MAKNAAIKRVLMLTLACLLCIAAGDNQGIPDNDFYILNDDSTINGCRESWFAWKDPVVLPDDRDFNATYGELVLTNGADTVKAPIVFSHPMPPPYLGAVDLLYYKASYNITLPGKWQVVESWVTGDEEQTKTLARRLPRTVCTAIAIPLIEQWR